MRAVIGRETIVENPLHSLAFFALTALVIWLNIFSYRKAKRLIREWAAEKGYAIVDMELRFIRRGPFLWTSGNAQIVYYVVLSSGSEKRSAFIRCGSFFTGLLSDNIDVEWQ